MLGDLMEADVAVHIGRDLDDADWPKSAVDLTVRGRVVRNQDELLTALREDGVGVEHFKTLPAYQRALESGRYPWLVGL